MLSQCCALVILVGLLADPSVAQSKDQADDKSAVEMIVRASEQAFQDYDWEKVAQLLTPNAVWIEEDSYPAPANKITDWWEKAKSVKLNMKNYPHDFDIRIKGDVAWVLVYVDTETTIDNEAARAFRMTDHPNDHHWVTHAIESEVLVKTDDGWKIALGHTSILPKQDR